MIDNTLLIELLRGLAITLLGAAVIGVGVRMFRSPTPIRLSIMIVFIVAAYEQAALIGEPASAPRLLACIVGALLMLYGIYHQPPKDVDREMRGR